MKTNYIKLIIVFSFLIVSIPAIYKYRLEMTIANLERVMWRVRKNSKGNKHPYNSELKRAIMYECGTSPVTFRNNRKALKDLGWIVPYNKIRITLTGKDIEDG